MENLDKSKLCEIGKRINYSRKSEGYTSNQVSEDCSISAEYFRQIESGAKTPSLPVFISICNVLHISPDYVLQDILHSDSRSTLQEFDEMRKNLPPREQGLIIAMLKGALDYMKTK